MSARRRRALELDSSSWGKVALRAEGPGGLRSAAEIVTRPFQLLNIVGARPNFMKIAPICAALAAERDRRRPSSSTPASTTTSSCRRCSSTSSAIPRPDVNLEVGSAQPRAADGGDHGGVRAGAARTARRSGARRRRRQLHDRVRARRGEARRAGRARRGRSSQLRSHDARGDQPGADRPDLRPALHDRGVGRDQPPARRHCRRIGSTSSAT